MSDYGDRAVGSTLSFDFNTQVFGTPTTLAGTPSLAAYKNSATPSTAGLTLSVDYNSKTGMHHVVVDTSADGTFYAAGNDFSVQIAAGTIGGVSAIGVEVGSFSLQNHYDVVALAAIQADLPQRITKNVALSAFPFYMVDSSDHVTGKTSLTVTATRSIDGAAFGACANAVVEVANGWYKIDLAAADLNGNTIALKFTATGADQNGCTIVTEPT